MIRSPFYGIYEYFGIQRLSGKTTLMTADALCRLLGWNIVKERPCTLSEYSETVPYIIDYKLFKDTYGLTSNELNLDRFYKPQDVIVNYPIFIPGIKPLNNEAWMRRVTEIKENHERHKLIIGDELNSILLARGSKSMTQSQFAVYVWQMPKMDNILLYTNNQVTGVDLIIRDATWCTIMPQYTPEAIYYSVIHNYEMITDDNLVFHGVRETQKVFDSYAPVD